MSPHYTSPRLNSIHRSPIFRSRVGFTLVELLAVVALISIMLVMAKPAITSLSSSGNFKNSVIQVSQTLDLARQQAIAKNTYVWVAINSNLTTKELGLCVVESRSGTDELKFDRNSGSVTIPMSPGYNMVQKAVKLPFITLEAAGAIKSGDIPSLPTLPTTAENLSTDVSFRHTGTNKIWGSADFNHVVQFTPTGEARVYPGLTENIELGLARTPQKGFAVIRINGITGLSTVYY